MMFLLLISAVISVKVRDKTVKVDLDSKRNVARVSETLELQGEGEYLERFKYEGVWVVGVKAEGNGEKLGITDGKNTLKIKLIEGVCKVKFEYEIKHAVVEDDLMTMFRLGFFDDENTTSSLEMVANEIESEGYLTPFGFGLKETRLKNTKHTVFKVKNKDFYVQNKTNSTKKQISRLLFLFLAQITVSLAIIFIREKSLKLAFTGEHIK